MARRDGTGPLGQGSMTGRGLGNCVKNVGNDTTTSSNVQAGLGLGRRMLGQGRGQMGSGMGFGCRRAPGMGRQMGCGRKNRGFTRF